MSMMALSWIPPWSIVGEIVDMNVYFRATIGCYRV